MDLSGAPCSANTPQILRLGVLALLQILCFQTAGSQVIPPNVYVEPSLDPVVAGDSPKLLARCVSAAAKPGAYVSWDTGSFSHKDFSETTQHENLTMTTIKELIMKPQRELYDFKVTCVATQENVQYNKSFVIKNIHFAPYKVYVQRHLRSDGEVELSCAATSNPPASYKWTWMKGSETLNIPGRSTFLVVPRNASDGHYTCEAENSIGSSSGSFYIPAAPGHAPWYIPLIFLIPSLILNAYLLYQCFKTKRASKPTNEVYS